MMHNITTQVGQIKWSKWATPEEQTHKQLPQQQLENWNVIFTCQPQAFEAVRDGLLDAGVEDSGRMDFEKPKVEEILAAVQSVLAILPLLMRKELQPILCNLIVLEWVIREEIAHRIPWRILTRSDAAFFGH
jgi:hypothetical protein